jgi:uncharacterized protein (DUF433 family)
MTHDRITHNADVMGGKACIRGMRVTVGMIVSQIGAGKTIEQVLVDFHFLEREDVLQALQYAAQLAENEMPDDDDLAWAAESIEAARRDVAEGHGMLLEEHRVRNAARLARLGST